MSNTYQKKSRRAQLDPMPAEAAVPGQVIVSMGEIAESAKEGLLALAGRTWAPLFDWVTARPVDDTLAEPQLPALPARDFWNAAVLGHVPGLIVPDDRPGAPAGYFYSAANADEAGQVLHAYQSTWLPQRLLDPGRRPALAAALTRASQNLERIHALQQRPGPLPTPCAGRNTPR